jgi:LysR family transcriptional regulator, transcriptional activator of nhaA
MIYSRRDTPLVHGSRMDRLNYHHLLYFFTVAREGSIARASARLGLAQPTVSAQIHALENELGRKLLERSGRGLKVTPAGETVLRYAGSIFAMGGELLTALDGDTGVAPALSVGVSASLPPALTAVVMRAISTLNPRPRLTIVEGPPEALCAQVASRGLHFAAVDTAPADAAARGLHSRVLLESPVALFAAPTLARKVGRDFPSRLAGLGVAMNSEGALRDEVERWLGRKRLEVKVVAEMPHPEFYATAAEAAIFAPLVLREWLRTTHGLVPAGQLQGSRWRTFLVTAGKAVKLPGVEAVIAAARQLG